jgi:hypothetical protein
VSFNLIVGWVVCGLFEKAVLLVEEVKAAGPVKEEARGWIRIHGLNYALN